MVAREPGYYFIRYSLSGPNAREFYLPGEDVLFVLSDSDITEDTPEEESIMYFPSGCHKKQAGVCPGLGYPIVATSTSPFIDVGPLWVTDGIVSIEVGNFKKLPLSLRGINLPWTASSFLNSCKDNEVVLQSAEPLALAKSRALPRSFTNAVTEGLPRWMNITLVERKLVKNLLSSDLLAYLLTGAKLQETGVGEGLPVVDDMFYSLLRTKYLNVTINNDQDILNSNDLSLVVELCGKRPLNVILQPFPEDRVTMIDNIGILKNLKQYGWHLNFDSIEFSKTNTIERPKKENFWDGENFFNVQESSDGTFAAVSFLRKNFRNCSFGDIQLLFEGTLIAKVGDVDQVIYAFYVYFVRMLTL